MELLTKASYSQEPNQRELDNLQVAYQAACEGMVLLKNEGILPLEGKRIALYGPGASMTIKGGTGSGEVNERHSVSILEGLQDRGFEILTRDWIKTFETAYSKAQKAYQEEKRKRVNILKPNSIMEMLFDNFQAPVDVPMGEKADTDTCIYVISRQAGEGGDRKTEKGDFLLTDAEVNAISYCASNYEKFLLVVNCGSFVDLTPVKDLPNAILYLCQLGTEGGHAFADVITGAVTPSGKLADTWAKSYEDIPFGGDFSTMGDPYREFYREGIYVGYRYFDSFDVEPAWPFGFGLSYTDFEIRSAGVFLNGTEITVKATVTNTGAVHSGAEVVQLYLSAPQGELNKEYQSLAAFAKTDVLAPGQRQALELTFDLRNLSSYSEADAAFILEQGNYVLRMGNSSRNTMSVGVITLESTQIVSRHCNICVCLDELDELTADKLPAGDCAPGVPNLILDTQIEPVEYSYEPISIRNDPDVEAMLEKLSPEEMVDVVVGIGMFGGETRFNLPGSVGNTTSKFWDRGLANVALCDGPAGLRIQNRSTVDAKGKVHPLEMAMSIFDAVPNFVKKMILGNPDKDSVIYQYTTAFPVATALAQSWNTGLMEQVGDAIAKEMVEYGCTFWLAPAVNIHRNPLCGRNFEYFSEDPRLAGFMAAAITRGVQANDGCYVTVKHFACNNLEDNRNKSDSVLSERALREIYLRTFETTVREGGAKSVMTSYNKVNGVYAPNSYDLCTRVLRNEWGFDGVVMTDWFSTNKGLADTALCMSAGNDLIMPGGSNARRAMLTALKSGALKEEDLFRCCANVIRAILDSNTQKEYIG